jgi:dCMP deaminase
MGRPTADQTFLEVADVLSRRATCARRQVGCVLTNSANQIIATGYNGVPPGWPHCSEGNPCPGAQMPSGQGLDLCYANHAEANALIQCKEPWQIDTCYVTCSPCISCVKLLLCTSTRRIVFMDEYAHNEAKGLWLSHGAVTMHKRFGKTSHDFYEREWVHVPRSAFISLEEQRLGPRGGDQRGGGGVLLRAKGGGAGRGDGN